MQQRNADNDRTTQDDGMERASEVVVVLVSPKAKETLAKGLLVGRRSFEAATAAFDAGMSEDGLQIG